MRTRTKSVIAVPTCQVNRGGTTSPYIANPINLGKTFSDIVTPGYFKMRRKNLHLPVNPASSSEMYFIPSGGNTSHEVWYAGNNNGWKWQKRSTVSLTGCVYCAAANKPDLPSLGIGSLPTFTQDEFNALLTRAAANAMTASMDILTFSAEAGKTARMISGVAGRALERAYRVRKSLGQGRINFEQFSQAWLEARYGWRPLMYDIQDASELISKLMSGTSELHRSSLTEVKSGSPVTTQTTTAGYSWRDLANNISGGVVDQGMRYTHTIRKTGSVQQRAGIMVRDAVRSYATVDPLVTGMELIPFSWMLAWFSNVQDFLTVVSPFSSSEMLHAYRTLTTVEETSVVSVPIPRRYSFNDGITDYRAFGSVTPLILGREGWVREPVAKLTPTIGRGSGLSVLKGLDALSLLGGRIRSLRRISTI